MEEAWASGATGATGSVVGMAEALRVAIAPGEAVTALLYPAAAERRAGVALILGHGAGAGQSSLFMVRCATDLAAPGIDVVTSIFPFLGAAPPSPRGTPRPAPAVAA